MRRRVSADRTAKCLATGLLCLGLAVRVSAQEHLRVGFAPFATPLSSIPRATPENWRSLDPATAEGALIDLYRALAQAEGFHLQFVPLPAGELARALDDATVDIRMVDDSPESGAALAVTAPVYRDSEVLLARTADPTPYRSYSDLADALIGTRTGTVYEAHARAAGLRTRSFVTAPELYAAVEAGEIPVAINTSRVATAHALRIGRYPHVRLVETYRPRFPRVNAIGATKAKAALIARLDHALARLRASGQLERMFRQYGLETTLVMQ